MDLRKQAAAQESGGDIQPQVVKDAHAKAQAAAGALAAGPVTQVHRGRCSRCSVRLWGVQLGGAAVAFELYELREQSLARKRSPEEDRTVYGVKNLGVVSPPEVAMSTSPCL